VASEDDSAASAELARSEQTHENEPSERQEKLRLPVV
jgi:hypothetical protein